MSSKSRRNSPPPRSRSHGPQGYRQGKPSGRTGQPKGNGGPGGAAPRSGFRPALERASAPWLLMLHRAPRWLIPVVLAVFLFTGLLLSGDWAWLGAVLLGIVAAFVAWLSALSWPVLSSGSRLARVLITVALTGVTVLKAMGRM